MKTKLLKILRSKFYFEHNYHFWFADYKSTHGVCCNTKTRNILVPRLELFIKKHNDYIGLSEYQLKKLGI